MNVRRVGPGEEADVLRAGSLFDEALDPTAVRTYLHDDRNIFLLADDRGEVAGFLRGSALGQLKSPRKQMFLYEIGVDERFRRKGIGKALTLHLIELCRASGFEEVFVFTDPSNEAAVNLYRSTGAHTETPADRMFVYTL